MRSDYCYNEAADFVIDDLMGIEHLFSQKVEGVEMGVQQVLDESAAAGGG
jgi:hypothetical protein